MNKKKILRYAILAIVAILAVGTAVDVMEPNGYGFFGRVSTASVGVVTRFGRISEEVLGPGFHVKGWFDRINQVSTRTQKCSMETSAFSSDIQQVDLAVVLNYNVDELNAPALFETVGENYLSTLILPRLIENVKIVIARYSAESLLENRGNLSSEILSLIQADLAPYGIHASGISIEDLDFTDAFTAAVEAKQVATQELQRARTQQEQATIEAQAAAERARIAAETEAEVARSQAEAEAYAISTRAAAEAEANRQLAESITEELIRYAEIQQWDGVLPETYIGSSDALPVINIGEDAALPQE